MSVSFPIEVGEVVNKLIEMNESVQNSRVLFNKWITAVYVANLIFGSLSMFTIPAKRLIDGFCFTEVMKQVCYPPINHQVEANTALMVEMCIERAWFRS